MITKIETTARGVRVTRMNLIRPYLWFAFLLGWLGAFGFDMLVQDWMGLHAYIEFVKESWVELHWGWGLGICALSIYSFRTTLQRNKWLKGASTIEEYINSASLKKQVEIDFGEKVKEEKEG